MPRVIQIIVDVCEFTDHDWPGCCSQSCVITLFSFILREMHFFREICHPVGDVASEPFRDVVVVRCGIFNRVVQHCCREHFGVFDAEDMACYHSNAEDVADIGRYSILSELMLVRPCRKCNSVEKQFVHDNPDKPDGMNDIFRIKICGVRSVHDAALVRQADAVGLNFYRASPRCVDLDTAKAIVREIPIQSVGVFVESSPLPVRSIAAELGLSAVQTYCEPQFSNDFAPTPHLPAFRVRTADDLASIRSYVLNQTTLPLAVLVDSHSETALGGTGNVAPWELLADFYAGVPLILAGGLTPGNVADAIRIVKPSGVDVASGVESLPGIKDRYKVADFLAAAREAFAAL